MLNSFCKGACALAAVLSFSAAAHAEEHVVLIVDGGFFPAVIVAAEGDALTFKNESTSEHTVVGENDAWTSGPIGVASAYTIELTSETPLSFHGDNDLEGEIILQ